MNTEPDYPTYEDWLASRPQCVQDAAKKWPPATQVLIGDQIHWTIGYAEHKDDTVGLLVSATNPNDDYETAVANAFEICPDCMTKHELSE